MTRPTPAPRPAIVYRRVSTEEQARSEKTSLADQLAGIEHLARRLGVVVAETFDDPGVSGAYADRPGFQAMVQYCEAHPRPRRTPGYVLVLNDSRWGRFPDPEEAGYWRVHLRKHGWLVRFAEGGEVEDPSAAFLLRSVHTMQATAYREAIRANAKRGARATAAKGLWQNEAPVGYRRLAFGGGRPEEVLDVGQRKADGQQVRLTPGPADEVAFITWLFTTYAAGGTSLGQLTREAHRRLPIRKWSRQTLGKILRNRTYLGEVVWCRRPHDRHEREITPIRPEEDWIVVPEAHEALVTPELFDQVQRQLATNQRLRSAVRGGYPLSGLITCVQCGEPYIGGGGPKGPRDDPDRYRFYRDKGAREDGTGRAYAKVCPGLTGTLQKRWVEPIVVGAVADVVEGPLVQALIALALDQEILARRGAAADAGATLAAERDRLETERRRLVQAVARGTLRDAEAQGELTRIRERLAELTVATDQAEDDVRPWADLARQRRRALDLAKNFRALADQLHGHELRELLRPWLQSATMDKERRMLTLVIRRVPALGLLESSPQSGLRVQGKNVRLTETRRISLPDRYLRPKRRRRA